MNKNTQGFKRRILLLKIVVNLKEIEAFLSFKIFLEKYINKTKNSNEL